MLAHDIPFLVWPRPTDVSPPGLLPPFDLTSTLAPFVAAFLPIPDPPSLGKS